jgi:hypothetical protein
VGGELRDQGAQGRRPRALLRRLACWRCRGSTPGRPPPPPPPPLTPAPLTTTTTAHHPQEAPKAAPAKKAEPAKAPPAKAADTKKAGKRKGPLPLFLAEVRARCLVQWRPGLAQRRRWRCGGAGAGAGGCSAAALAKCQALPPELPWLPRWGAQRAPLPSHRPPRLPVRPPVRPQVLVLGSYVGVFLAATKYSEQSAAALKQAGEAAKAAAAKLEEALASASSK